LRLSHALREKLEDSALRAVNALHAHLEAVISFEAGRESKSRFAHIAAKKMLPVLAEAAPMAIAVRLAALAIYYDEEPTRFQGDDEVWRASVFQSFRRLAPIVDSWTTYRTGKNAGKVKGRYYTIPERARQYGSTCLLETFASHIALLRRIGKEVTELRRIESAAALELTAETAEEFRLKRELVRRVKDRMIRERAKQRGAT
jgi:hypothetical protein